MEKENIDSIIRESFNKFLSHQTFREIIRRHLNKNPSAFQIKAKGEEKANLAINRIQSQKKRLSKLIKKYFTAVEEAKKNKKLPPEEKLKILISPLSEIQKITFPNYPKYHQFVDDRYIDLERELDLKRLTPDSGKYTILGDGELQILRILNTESKYIILNDYYEISYNDRISVSDIYNRGLLPLNQETLRSKDLLTQILVCYTIKRALNGDDKAIQKLYDLYKDGGQGIAVKIGKRFRLFQEIEDMKQDALILLGFLITGFRPDDILERLLKDKSDRTIMAFPKWVKNFYIYYLSEYVPKRLGTILAESEEINRLIGFANGLSSGKISKADLTKQDECTREAIEKLQNKNITGAVEWLRSIIGVLGLEVVTLLNLYTPIQDGTVWKHTPKRLNRFNTYSFQPGIKKMGPRWNLTTWLFGRRNEIDTLAKGEREDGTIAKAWQPYGKLYQLLRDKYKPLIKERSKTKKFGFRDDFDEDHEESLDFEDRTKALGGEDFIKSRDKLEDQMIANEKIQWVKKCLFALNASHRNIGIYLQWKSGKTQSKIAKQCRLSERQIRRICQQIKELIPIMRLLSTKNDFPL